MLKRNSTSTLPLFLLTLTILGLMLISSALTVAVDAAWSKTITLKNYLNDVKFREELLSYEIDFPGTFPKENLKLSEGSTVMEYQLSNVQEDGYGNLESATVWFRAGLDASSSITSFPTRTFVLEEDSSYNANFPDRVTFHNNGDGTATIKSNLQTIMVPYNVSNPYTNHAPIMKISRDEGSTWVGEGSINQANAISTSIIENGNLYLIYRIIYDFGNNKEYQVDLKVQYNEKHVTVDEKMTNISIDDGLQFKFSYDNGVNPNGRLAIGDAKYSSHDSGVYYEGRDANGKLPYNLGIFSYNASDCKRATVFWNDSGSNAIAFSLYKLKDWKTEKYYAWSMKAADEALYFYDTGTDEFMQVKLGGERRYWAISLIPRDEVTVESQDGSRDFYWYATSDLSGLTTDSRQQMGGGPEIRLFQKLGGFSLNWFKDLTFEWNDTSARYVDTNSYTFSEWKDFNNVPYNGYNDRMGLYNKYFDAFAASANNYGRTQPDSIGAYASSRASWDYNTRLHVRSWIIWFINAQMDLQEYMPFSPMMADHPNFAAEGFFPGIYCAVFPNYPRTAEWKADYYEFLENWLKIYIRKDNPQYNTLAGRAVENISCYNFASLDGIYHNLNGFKNWYDGTDITEDAEVKDGLKKLLNWNMNSLVTAADIAYYNGSYSHVPPIGDHSNQLEDPDWKFEDTLYNMATMVQNSLPTLSSNLKWCLTQGAEGTKPNLESVLFNDFGGILRYDFGGQDETYLYFANINGETNEFDMSITTKSGSYNRVKRHFSDYRWGRGALGGNLIYASQGTIYSWNEAESYGVYPDAPISTYQVGNNALNYGETDEVLYNFDFAQFFRGGDYKSGYISRAVMMVREDYVGIYDDVNPGTSGIFKWETYGVSTPDIIGVKTGDDDNLHVVGSPGTLSTASSISAGAIVNSDEYVFMEDGTETYSDSNVSFDGINGYARVNELAIFEGTSISYDDFGLSVSGGDFGASAKYDSTANSIAGRFAGKSGGTISVTLPSGFDTTGISVKVEGSTVSHTLNSGVVSFDVTIAQSEGYRSYTITGGSGVVAHAIPGQIEAEDYSAMSGVVVKSGSDSDGTDIVGWVDAGDWMDYEVNVDTTGTYTVEYRVASGSNNITFELRDGSTVLDSQDSATTGSWTSWKTISGTVNLTAGNNTLRIYAVGDGWDINWLKFTLDSSGSTTSFTPVADVYIRAGSYADNNYGTNADLIVKEQSSPGDYTRRTYIKFDLSSAGLSSVNSAKIKLYCNYLYNNTAFSVTASQVSDDSWTEGGITWNNAPAIGSNIISNDITATGQYFEWDVTNYVNSELSGDKIITIALHDPAKNNLYAYFNSKEAGSNKPVLEVSTSTTTPQFSGYYRLVNKYYNEELDANSGDDFVQNKTITQNDDRKWDFVHISGDYYQLVNKAYGKYLEAESGDGAQARARVASGLDNQIWEIVDSGDGYYFLYNKAYGTELDANSDSYVRTRTVSGGGDRKWDIISTD